MRIADRIRPRHVWWALAIIALLSAWFLDRSIAAVLQERKKDFYEFFCAAEAMVQRGDLYNVGGTGYIYPPILAFLLMPLVPLGLWPATAVWGGVCVGVMLLCAWLGSREVLARMGRDGTANPAQHRAVVAVVMAAALLVAADKMRSEVVMGQSNLLMVLAWTLGLVWLDRRPVLAGVAIGFGANIKYLTLVSVPYLIVRGRFKAAAAAVGGAVMWAFIPALHVGWDVNMGYLRKALGGLVGMVEHKDHAEVVAHAQEAARIPVMNDGFSMSITSWAGRVTAGVGANLWTFALLGAIGAGLLGLVWLIYRHRGRSLFVGRWGRAELSGANRGAVALEWAGLVIASLAFGPQTNSRHLTMALLPIVIAVGVIACGGCGRSSEQADARRGAAGHPVWPLVSGLAILWAGLTLPFGTEATRDAIDAWRTWAGPSWCLLVMFLTLLWVGLGELGSERSVEVSAS